MSNSIFFGMNSPRVKSPSRSPDRSLLSPGDAHGVKRPRPSSISSNSSVSTTSSTGDRFTQLRSKLETVDPTLAKELDDLKASHERGRGRRKDKLARTEVDFEDAAAELENTQTSLAESNAVATQNYHAATQAQEALQRQEGELARLRQEKENRRRSSSGGSPLRRQAMINDATQAERSAQQRS